MKEIIRIWIFIILFFQGNNLFAQSFADKNNYLVDSLIWEKVSLEDQHMIDSCMKVFHSSKNDTYYFESL